MTIEIELWQYLLTVVCLGSFAVVFALLLNRESKWSMHWQQRALDAEARLEQIRILREGRPGESGRCP